MKVRSEADRITSARSGAAESLVNDLIRPRRRGMALLARLVIVGRCQHLDDLLERHEIALFNGRLDHFFDPMIARNEGRID